MNPFWKRIAAVGFLLFVALLVAGVIRSFSLGKSDLLTISSHQFAMSSSSSAFEEYRSGKSAANNLAEMGLAKTPLPQVLEQADVNKIVVFDKTAELAAGTTAFGEDEQAVRKAIAAHKAVTFSEKAGGIAPGRTLVLGISVPPDQFDALLAKLSQIGQLESINVLQQDRTGEFRKLFAQRQSLQKHLEAILKLRTGAAKSVEETLKLEAKILDVEKENQGLGVQLGDLLGKEPAYNLFLTLAESRPGGRHDNSVSLAQRLGTAVLWSLGWWLVAALSIGLVIGAYVSVQTLRPTRTTAQTQSG